MYLNIFLRFDCSPAAPNNLEQLTIFRHFYKDFNKMVIVYQFAEYVITNFQIIISIDALY